MVQNWQAKHKKMVVVVRKRCGFGVLKTEDKETKKKDKKYKGAS